MIFLPKPEKPRYDIPNSFRPISKFNVILKGLEKLVNPIRAGFWNDVVGWGGALSAQVSVLEGSPLWIYYIKRNKVKKFGERSTIHVEMADDLR